MRKEVTSRHPCTVERVIGGSRSRSGRELWRVASRGKIVTLSTSALSARAMDEAMKIYGRALRRLANK